MKDLLLLPSRCQTSSKWVPRLKLGVRCEDFKGSGYIKSQCPLSGYCLSSDAFYNVLYE